MAIAKKCANSFLDLLPLPSDMFAATENEALRNWLVSPNDSLLGKLFDAE